MDKFSSLEALASLTGVASSRDGPSLEDLEKEQAALVESLMKFDRKEAMAMIAALLTYPQFHANTIRLETVQQLAQRNCKGANKPTRHRVAAWLKALGSGWASLMEDPVEDVFISNVVTNTGNSRVFEGIWEANDFWLQQALNALRSFRGEEWADRSFDKINGLLAVSEELARRCNLPRFMMGGGFTRTDLDLPLEAELQARAMQLHFSPGELVEIGAPLELLEDFVHDDDPAEGTESDSTLQRRPLQQCKDEIIVAIPAAISPTIRLHIVEQLVRLGKIAPYETALFTQQVNQLFIDGLANLGTERVSMKDLPPLPANTPAKVQEIAQFDDGRFAHIIFFEDRVLDFLERGVIGVLDLLQAHGDVILKHTQDCAEKIAARRDYRGGLTIAIVGGLGRSFVFGLGELPPHWYGTAFRLPDFLALSRVHRTKLLDIWKLKEQERSLSSRGIEVMNVNGELNLLGFWRSNSERLLPRDVPIHEVSMLQVGTDFIAGVRHEMRTKYDFHAVPRRNPDIWVPVRRYNIEPHFKELENELIYADEAAVRNGRLRGVVETRRRYWWFSTVEHYEDQIHRGIQFRIWEALLFWLPKIASIAEAEIDNLPEGPIEILLRFNGIEGWRSERLHDLPEGSQEIAVRIAKRLAMIELSLPVAFLRQFAQPKNLGERNLIAACFKGIAALVNCLQTFDRAAAVERVVPNDDARFFHIAYAQNFRQHTSSVDPLRPRFVGEGDVNFASLGLVQRLLPGTESAEILGEEDCNRFLHRVVDDCWDRARSVLQKLSRHSVVTIALRNVEAIEQDRHQWELTANAVLATHTDREDVVAAAHKRENDRAEAALVSRVIIEMAVCTSPLVGNVMGQADFDELLGLVRLLLYAATSSDAIKYKLTPAKLVVLPNGEFVADDHYYKTIIKPYTSEQFAGQFETAAETYPDYFTDPSGKRTDRAKPFEAAFIEAFKAEYGLTPDEFVDAYQAIEAEAMSDQRLVVSRTIDELRSILTSKGLPAATDRLIHYFALWPRPRWDDTPVGFARKDWYPWRYRRRLSLLSRPFVRLGNKTTDPVVFAPGLLRDCIQLLFGRLISGWLPAEAFRSPVMRSWIGEITRRRGDEFEEKVGDELRKAQLEALVSQPMTIFGADQSYGDLDALGWRSGSSDVYTVECKRLRSARTVAEIGEQLREFHGAELDRLSRHLRRCRWLSEHLDAVRQVTGIQAAHINVIPLLVTSTIVPMQFIEDLPISPEQIVPITKLRGRITSRS